MTWDTSPQSAEATMIRGRARNPARPGSTSGVNGRAGRPDRRGNQRDRRRRKQWLLSTFGDGTTAPCAHCGKPLTSRTCEADRIVPGGSYRHDNIIPACRFCNASRGNKPLGAA